MTNKPELTDNRSRLRDAAKNYQTALAWYQSNIDSPAALQTWDAATSEFMRAIGYRETYIIADLLDEIDELQERRKADSAEPIYQYRISNGYNGQVTEWQTIRRDQVDFVLKAQPLNAEFRIISAPQPAPLIKGGDNAQ